MVAFFGGGAHWGMGASSLVAVGGVGAGVEGLYGGGGGGSDAPLFVVLEGVGHPVGECVGVVGCGVE